MKTLNTIFALGLMAALSGCGEAYQATYKGQVEIAASSCGAMQVRNPYDAEVTASISGDDVEVKIVSLTNSSGVSYDLLSALRQESVSAGFTSGKEDFAVYNKNIGDTVYTVRGILTASRDQLQSFQYVRQGYTNNAPGCMINVVAPKALTRKD